MKVQWANYLKGSYTATVHGTVLRAKHFLARKHRKSFVQATNWSGEEFDAYQKEALKALVLHAVQNVPYYQEHSAEYLAGEPLSLENLPVLSKAAVRGRIDHFYAANVSRVREHRTSGTSGSPLVIRMSYRTHSLFQAGIERYKAFFGLEEHERTVALTGFFRPAANPSGQLWWRDFIGNRMFFNIYQFNDANAKDFAVLLKRFRPRAIFGYASTVYLLAAMLKRNKLAAPEGVKMVLTTSEVLYENWRSCIEEVFQAPVADHYGSQEGQCLITECPDGRMHINPEHGIVEVVGEDRRPVADGQEGDILITGLANDAMPLIRYAIGDRGTLTHLASPCKCGLQWPVIGKIAGRSEDVVWTPDGRPITYLNFHSTKNVAGIIESQFIQDGTDHLKVLIVKDGSFTEDGERAVREEIRRRCGYDFNIEIEHVQSIPRGPRGKFKAVVNLLPGKSDNS